MNRVLLFIVGLFRKPFEYLGVDFLQLKAIVGTKLTMDNRRNVVAFGQQKAKEQSNRFWVMLLTYGFLGVFVAFAIIGFPSFIIGMAVVHSFLMVMICMTLISDFSSVLMDTSDNTIILPRPVSSRTLVAARITHITLYVGQITLGLILAPFFATAFKYGIGMSFLLLLTTSLSVVFIVVFTNGFYLFLMRIATEERLKSIINYFQIIITVAIMGGYQIFPRMMGNDFVRQADLDLSWWFVLAPPLWMAGFLDLIHSHATDSIHVTLSLLAILIPAGGIYVMNKFLAPLFARKLADLGTPSEITTTNESKSKTGFRMANLITKPGLERAAYEMVSTLTSRDRKLKLKIYPGIGYVFIMTFVYLFRGKNSIQIMWNDLPYSSTYIFLLYASFFVVQTALFEVSYSDEFRASWIFGSSPIEKPGEILSGTWKAILIKFFVPVYLVFAVLILLVWKINSIDDIVFALASNVLLFLITVKISSKHLPFSMEATARKQAGNFMRVMLILVALALTGTVHYLLAKIPYALWVGVPLIVTAVYFFYKSYRDTPWADVEF
jgi:ABC-2 type transport system permease protein